MSMPNDRSKFRFVSNIFIINKSKHFTFIQCYFYFFETITPTGL